MRVGRHMLGHHRTHPVDQPLGGILALDRTRHGHLVEVGYRRGRRRAAGVGSCSLRCCRCRRWVMAAGGWSSVGAAVMAASYPGRTQSRLGVLRVTAGILVMVVVVVRMAVVVIVGFGVIVVVGGVREPGERGWCFLWEEEEDENALE